MSGVLLTLASLKAWSGWRPGFEVGQGLYWAIVVAEGVLGLACLVGRGAAIRLLCRIVMAGSAIGLVLVFSAPMSRCGCAGVWVELSPPVRIVLLCVMGMLAASLLRLECRRLTAAFAGAGLEA